MQTDEDRVSGVLRLMVGGVEKEVPTLPIRPAREWQRQVTAVSGGFGLPGLDDWQTDDAGHFANLTLDTLLDLAVAYDRTAALGGREWLEDNANPRELYDAVVAMAENAFPFAEDGRAILGMVIAQATLAEPTRPKSPNGRSRSGGSTPGGSRTPSTRSS
jgi:hypothetical protein